MSALTDGMRPGETPKQYAERLLKRHGPPPPRVVDIVHGLQRQAAAKRTA
ncbi:hypothetical protein [Janibacter terrae]|nr:hypothetical protein [Janibacter terrae]